MLMAVWAYVHVHATHKAIAFQGQPYTCSLSHNIQLWPRYSCTMNGMCVWGYDVWGYGVWVKAEYPTLSLSHMHTHTHMILF